jgi:hypothetical protein
MVRGYWLFMVTKQLLRGKGRWKLVLSEILFGSVRHRPSGPCANRDHLNSHPFFRIICRQNRRARQIGSPAFRRVARTISVWSSSGPKIRCAICFNPPSATPPSPRPIRNGSWSSTARQRDFRLLVGHQILAEGSHGGVGSLLRLRSRLRSRAALRISASVRMLLLGLNIACPTVASRSFVTTGCHDRLTGAVQHPATIADASRGNDAEAAARTIISPDPSSRLSVANGLGSRWPLVCIICAQMFNGYQAGGIRHSTQENKSEQ